MHLAICDDHIADRKQMERLLGRESDRRLSSTGVLYVDSFGSKNSLLTVPMIYDAIFLDMTEDGCDAVELANMLRTDGATAPIVFCSGKVNYREARNLPENCFFLDKPILVAELTGIVDQLLVIKGNQIKKLEFRNRSETYYVTEDELLYAWPSSDREMLLHLLNGEEHTAEMTLKTFCDNLAECESYIELTSRTVLNMHYIREINFFRVTMTDGRQFRLSFGESRPLQKALAEYRQNANKAAD